MSLHGAQTKEPLIRMVKRDTMPQKKAWGIRAAAFILSLVTGGIVILMLGHNPFSVYISMVKGAWGSSTVIHETIKLAVPLLITAIGISFAFKMKFWNIGAEGQILVGAVAAGAFGLFTAHIFPKLPLVLLMMLASIVAGGIYGLLPAVCKAKWGTNETLFTLMLNYIADERSLESGRKQFPKDRYARAGRAPHKSVRCALGMDTRPGPCSTGLYLL